LFVAVAAVFTVHLAGALVIAVVASNSAQRELDERLAVILDSRAKLMAAPLWKMQYESVAAVLKELAANPEIVCGRVYDDSGAIIATTRSEGEGEATITRSQPIVYKDGNIQARAGLLEVQVAREPIADAFWRSLQPALLIALMATGAIIIGIWIASQKYIGRPLTLIATAIDRSRADGKRHKVQWDSDDEFGAVTRAFNAMQDAAERGEHALHAANRRLDFLALHDELTGLPNRRSFEERLRQAAEALGDEAGALAVHFIDLDDFKGINDTLGHAAGDKLLRHVGQRLRVTVGEAGFAARFGGDEFVVLQRGVADEADARRLAERLIAAIEQPCVLYSNTVRTGASIGIALMEGDPAEVVRLLSLADIALYQAKRENRGTISFLTRAARDQHSRRRRMESDIRVALEQRQFLLHFQPQVRLDTLRPVAVEALVRWQHPVDGLMSPTEFLPIVDELGLSTQLGALVIDEACRAARQLRDRGHRIRVAVNLSGAQLVDHGLVQQLEAKLDEFRLPAAALEVEITEVALIRDPHNAQSILCALRELGITISLDDFGTGYSSLAYLRRFPIDRIKLDRSFVRELPEFAETAAIVRAIKSLSEALRVDLVAEGTEREAEAQFLEREGILTVQGYLHCKPVPLADLCAWLDRRGRAVSKAA
jgi:diguanylate cyclase (GGDEF)-like protein